MRIAVTLTKSLLLKFPWVNVIKEPAWPAGMIHVSVKV